MMTESKTLFEDATEMMKIFSGLSTADKAVAIAYTAGRAGWPLDIIRSSPKTSRKKGETTKEPAV